jgi:ubiquinone/menaquinone biosynthesis C-methylase UbiE
MSIPVDQPLSENIYPIDHESGAEMARLMEQDHLFTKGMRGLFAECSDLSQIHRILDVACGPGGWALEVAFAYPEKEVVAFDISETMINYARTQALVQGLQNVSFRVMDALQPLDFPAASFDLVNARIIAFLPPKAWPSLIHEFLRITRPGGIIRLTETELSVSSSPALERMQEIFTGALKAAGQSLSPDGRRLGITPQLGRFLRQAGCINVQNMAHAIDYSAGTEAYTAFYQDWKMVYKLAQPFYINTGVTTQQEVDRVYEQMLLEMMSDDFCAVHYLLTVWGEKP